MRRVPGTRGILAYSMARAKNDRRPPWSPAVISQLAISPAERCLSGPGHSAFTRNRVVIRDLGI